MSVVLPYLKSLHPEINLSPKLLTLKLSYTDGFILSGQRRQSLHTLKIPCMKVVEEKIVFQIVDLLKTSRPGKHFQHWNLIPLLRKVNCV